MKENNLNKGLAKANTCRATLGLWSLFCNTEVQVPNKVCTREIYFYVLRLLTYEFLQVVQNQYIHQNKKIKTNIQIITIYKQDEIVISAYLFYKRENCLHTIVLPKKKKLLHACAREIYTRMQ